MYDIRLIERENMFSIMPLLKTLNPKIPTTTLNGRLTEMLEQGYQCVGVYDAKQLIGISGIWILNKYYVGKHVEPDNVYILPEYQGKGIGKLLIDWIFAYARSIDCEASELNCYIGNEAGQRFWKQLGYEVVAYHFQKKF